MNIAYNNIKSNDLLSKISLYEVAIIIMTVKITLSILGRPFEIPEIVDTILIVFSLFIFILEYIVNFSYSLKDIILTAILASICLYTSIISKDYNMMITFLLIFSSKNKNFKKTLKYINITKIVLLISICIIYLIILIFRETGPVYKSNILTYTFGFTTANTFAMFCLWCMIEYTYLYFDYFNLKMCSILIFLSLLIGTFSKCKTFIILIFIWLIGLTIIKKNKCKGKLIQKVSQYFFIIIGVLYYVLVIQFYNRGGILYTLSTILDSMLTGRIRNTALLYQIYGITILGQKVNKGVVKWDSYYSLTSVTVDGAYAAFFVQVGIIYFILLSIGFYFLVKRGKKIDALLVILYSLFSLSEMFSINAFFCFPVLLAGRFMFSQIKIRKLRK